MKETPGIQGNPIRDKDSEKLKLQAKCLYITTLMKRDKIVDHSNPMDITKEPISSLKKEIGSCDVDPEDLGRYLKDEKCSKEDRLKFLEQYRKIINGVNLEGKTEESIESSDKKGFGLKEKASSAWHKFVG